VGLSVDPFCSWSDFSLLKVKTKMFQDTLEHDLGTGDAAVRPSVCPSVCLSVKAMNEMKDAHRITSFLPPSSAGTLFFETNFHTRQWLQTTLGWVKRQNRRFSTNKSLYLRNDRRSAHSYNGRLIGNHIYALNQYQ